MKKDDSIKDAIEKEKQRKISCRRRCNKQEIHFGYEGTVEEHFYPWSWTRKYAFESKAGIPKDPLQLYA